MLYLILGYIPSLLAGIHAVRTARAQTWLWILVIAPGLGPTIYFFAEILPEMLGGRTARSLSQSARKALDPERELRIARAALDDAPTIGAHMRVAQAAAALERWEEAETSWAAAAQGQYSDDPVILLGRATALIELGRFRDALDPLEKLRALGKDGQTGAAALAFARAYEGLGRYGDAEEPYRYAADRVPGLEAGARYVAFMARVGRRRDAEIGLEEIRRRFNKVSPAFRREARIWRDLAEKAVTDAAGPTPTT
jgi:hypothetical protein